tara:strand:+ start:213 stop:371 length:159 start_codon:yes stop_codon:yes gene_type:complete
MDFYNNNVGRTIGASFNFFSTEAEIANAILLALQNGDLKYINGSGELVPTDQ